MGMFDRVHADGKIFQTKAFGKLLRDYKVGDTVKLTRASFSMDEFHEWGFAGLPVEEPDAYQVMCLEEYERDSDYSWIQVRSGVLISVGEKVDGVPEFGYYGDELQ